MPLRPHRTAAAALAALGLTPLTAPVHAQPAAPAPAPPAAVEVTTTRQSDTEQRRAATAAKTIIGRDEIERFGDSTLGEVLRRLPGVTTPGAPGRGGPPRLRGLGNGYTQLLLDGQRMPPGFSLESVPPEQVERIEILRAPTAETGAQAIAGTLNIVLREGFRRRANEFRTGVALENGIATPGAFWSRSDTTAGGLSYSASVSAFDGRRRSDDRVETTDVDRGNGQVLSQQVEQGTTDDHRPGVHANARLQWRLGDGDSLVLSPNLFHNGGRSERVFTNQTLAGTPRVPYDGGQSTSDGGFSLARLNAQWRTTLDADTRLELSGNVSGSRGTSASHRVETLAGSPLRTLDDDGTTRQRTLAATAKFTHTLGGDPARPGSEQQIVAGLEAESTHRAETRRSWEDGVPLLTGYAPTLDAASQRLALYAQDEWAPSPHWALHAGWRWEGIATTGDGGNGEDGTRVHNRSGVPSPLLHAVWKPDPKGRDQVRLSLTRSYRAPALASLIARPVLSTRFPADSPNDPTSPDRAGNPDLRPERATGVDLAFERYPAGGGVLSATVFHRRIRDLMRNVTGAEPETVPWSSAPRYVARQRNVGDATTQGLELESRFTLDQVLDGAPRVDLRANLALYRSAVDGVPGPDNRLDQQARATGNLGADYRFRGGALAPLALGGNVNWVPATETQTAADQRVTDGGKRVLDLYLLWTFDPALALRLLASNALPRDSESTNTITTASLVETARSTGATSTNWQLRLEFKL